MCKKPGLPCIECFIEFVIKVLIKPVADKLGAHMQKVEKAINGLMFPMIPLRPTKRFLYGLFSIK
jgi:hypothetical protein